jgi:phosphatidylglycerophosphate synthase
MGFISKEGLEELDNYKYKGAGWTTLDKLMNPFWEWCDLLIPYRVAPNLITFIGFFFMGASYLMMLYYDRTLTQVIPTWVYFTSAFFQFIYQTLDAVDGKHARRTKSSSPLGQLFDHGCDSFSLSFLLLSISQSTRLGSGLSSLLYFNLIQWIFYASNWAEHYTGELRTGVGNFGVTEGELIIIAAITITGIDADFLTTPIATVIQKVGLGDSVPQEFINRFLFIDLKDLVIYTIEVGVFLILIVYAGGTIIRAKKPLKALSEFLPHTMNMLACIIWSQLPIFQDNVAWILLICGVIYSLITSRVIVCSLTKMDYPIIQLEYLVNLLTAVFLKYYYIDNPRACLIGLGVLTVYVALSSIFWARGCVNQITSYLGIYCFSIDKRERVKLQ